MRQAANGRQPGLYAILDKTTNELVTDEDGTLETFPMKDIAGAWIGRQVYLEQSVMIGPGR